jgi:hypothetical protein
MPILLKNGMSLRVPKGHRMPRPGTEEEETVGEHCVIDGLEEATHDQMLEARREKLEQEGEIL